MRFGDRCQLCMAMNDGSSIADETHFHSSPKCYRIYGMNGIKYIDSGSRNILINDKWPRDYGFDCGSHHDCAIESGYEVDVKISHRRDSGYAGPEEPWWIVRKGE
ncbi:hypothetical protein F5Y03DRAFT_302268 [Xylaria venustula]|nr:hypothetical protein F5Y03DRAFT_302268 [Xylaria venustula]